MKKFFFVSLLFFFTSTMAQKDVVTPPAAMVARDMPDIPLALKVELQPYTESRAASFTAWHPKKTEMLISTRFGNVPQLHQVRMPLGDRKQITFYEDPVSDATYEPTTADYFLFSKDVGGNEFSQIYRYDVKTAKITMLTEGGRTQNGGIHWLKNKSGMIVFASTMRNGADRDFYLMNPLDTASLELMLKNKGGGWGIADCSSKTMTFLIGESISANESRIWLYNHTSGIKTPITDTSERGVVYSQARFNKDETGFFFVTDKGNEFKRLAYMDFKTKHISYLTNMPWDVEGYDLSNDGQKIIFTTNEAGLSKCYLYTLANKKISWMSALPQGVYSIPEFHPNSIKVALSINSARSAADIFVLDVISGAASRWTESEMGGLVPDELSSPKLVTWKSFDSLAITGFYYPASNRFSGKRPVIINIHGGPEGQSRPSFIGASNYFINELGIAMIFPNVRGSVGYGKTFLALDNGMQRENSVKDIGALLDWIARQPELDASRIMVTGGSYGGYMTLAVATHYNDRIRCGLDVVGISNFNTFLKNTESYRRDLRRVEYGDERNPTMYAFLDSISPLNNAQRITKPLFIVQGGNDPRVPRTEAEQMADKVRANGGNVWYLEAKDEGHGFRKKNNADFQRLATVMFIRKYLL